tara:strand:+ start:19605 stop:20057 length:453 start_codon:yes stop_codon:yes gene_type:complete
MKHNKQHIKKIEDFLNEEKDNVVYNTNYAGMVNGAIANLYTNIMAIAQELANEKLARDPYNSTGDIEEVDISRALNLIFHSDWKKNMKEKCLQGIQLNAANRANKKDDISNKKNQRALARLHKNDNTIEIDTTDVRFSDQASGNGPGSNQ